MEERNIQQQRSPKAGGTAKKEREAQRTKRGFWGVKRVGDSHPRARGPFSLGRWAARFCVFFTPKTSRRLIIAQLLDPFSINSL